MAKATIPRKTRSVRGHVQRLNFDSIIYFLELETSRSYQNLIYQITKKILLFVTFYLREINNGL